MKQNETNQAAETVKKADRFEATIAMLKHDRDAIVAGFNEQIKQINIKTHELRQHVFENIAKAKELQTQKEIVYKEYRERIQAVKDEGLEYYTDHGGRLGHMLSRFFDTHPEIHELWDKEKDGLYQDTQKQEGGAE